MTYYFSPSTVGFYISGVHSHIPTDAVSISEHDYIDIQTKLATGLVLKNTNGLPATADADLAMTWDAVARRRDLLLASSDWTQLSDSPLTDAEKQAWSTYRTALRNIPNTGTDPSKVVWPVSPSDSTATPTT